MSRAILAFFAHPDDEAFGTGGTLARAAAAGAAVTLVCATRGEVGEISDPALATPETLGRVREGEMRCAARALGIGEVIFLDHRDSGMAGTPQNDAPRAFMNVPAEHVVPRLVGLIRQLRPQVVITFDPEGGYGHPEHIAIHRHTVAAVQAAADPASHPEHGPAWQTGRLLYTAIPRSRFRALYDQMAAAGMDTSGYERFRDIGTPDDQIQVEQDVAAQAPTKLAALQSHQTQFGPDSFFRQLPDSALQESLSREYFIQGWPAPPPCPRLADLFAGL